MELAFALERAGVHEFDCDLLVVGECSAVHGAEASLAKAVRGGKGRGGGAEGGVGETVGWFGVRWDGAFTGEFSETKGQRD